MKVLFVCTGNTCRSPMAKALFEEYVKGKDEDIAVISAGLDARGATSQYAIAALLECGINLSAENAIQVDNIIFADADVVFAMTKAQATALAQTFGQADKIRAVREITGYDIPDPYGMGLKAYRECCVALRQAIPKIYDYVKKLG